jgi:DNA polymerase III alpha subunit
VTYPHPLLEPILERTLGVPLFQEQLLRMAMAVADFTPGEAEALRRAMGFKRSAERMSAIENRLRAGMAKNGITGERAEEIVRAITSFALYGFPECVDGETRVIDALSGRRIKIEDVALGRERLDMTLACDADLRLRPRRVLKALASGRKKIFRMRTALGHEIMATAEHPFLTIDGWRNLKNLRIGDPIATARLAASDLYWDRVTAIEPMGLRETYDLQIEGDHNFLANDFVVHNSHAASFALIAYASAYLKVHHAAAFLCAMLNNYPLGFYHPATLVKDAQRHGVEVLPIDVTRSGWSASIENGAVRLGLRYVKRLREQAGRGIEAERIAGGFSSLADFVRRTDLRRDELEALAHAGALGGFGRERRDALWQLARLDTRPQSLFCRTDDGPEECSPLPAMLPLEETVADYTGTGMTVGPHLLTHMRAELRRRGVLSAVELRSARNRTRVRVAGHVIVRQRPGTAKGLLFLTLEDETGTANAVVMPDVFEKHRALLHGAPILLVEGPLENVDGVIHVRGQRFEALPLRAATPPSHDFR